MKNLYLLLIGVLCFACNNSNTALDDLTSQTKKEKAATQSQELSDSLNERRLKAIMANEEIICNHDYKWFATDMPNELYLSSGGYDVTFRFWVGDTFVLALRPLISDQFGGYQEVSLTYYKIRPIEWSSYSEFQFPLPYHPHNIKQWEVRIYSKECFSKIDFFQFKHGYCNNYLSSKFKYDPNDWNNPSYSIPLRMTFTEVKKK